MNDVSCQVIRGYLDFLGARGHDINEFLARAKLRDGENPQLDATYLTNGRNFVSWETYIALTQVLQDYLPDRAAQEEFFEISAGLGSKWMPLRKAAHLISSPKKFIYIYLKYIAPVAFGKTVQLAVSEVEGGRLHFRCEIPPDRPGSTFFMLMTGIGLEKMPMMIGYPDAAVEARFTDRVGEFLITLPRSNTMWARLFRSVRVLLFTQAALEEFGAQDQRIRDDFRRLVASEGQLREMKKDLEIRISERTRELQQANVELQARLEEISRKEKENRDLQDRLFHAQKIEALGALAGGMSHEINNVLHGVFLSVEAAERALDATSPAAGPIQAAKKFALRGQNVMKQVLAFSRKQQFRRQLVPLSATIREAMELMRSTLPKNIELIEDYSANMERAALLGDATQLQQVVVNLCSNAAYAMRAEGGPLTVRLIKGEGDVAVLSITDTGEGISEEVQKRIFEPFFTTKPVGEGSGLGLSVVHGIVHALGGQISVTSHGSHGTTFIVNLPIESKALIATPPARSTATAGGRERLLVIDDEVELLELIEETLRLSGYAVTTSSSADQALHLFREVAYDLVLTDWVMPRVSGIELAKSLKALRPEVPIILCTGSDDATLSDDERRHISAFVMKPFDGVILNELIRRTLESSAK